LSVSAAPHLLLVNLGTPTAPTAPAVREFLAEFLADPEVVDLPRWLWGPILRGVVLRRRPLRVAKQYASIWAPEGSPLRVATERMVRGVRALSAGRIGVSAAYRYGEPSLDAELARLAGAHAGPVCVVPLFPQRTGATTGTIVAMARRAAARTGIAGRVLDRMVAPDDAGYVAALAARWREGISAAERTPEHLVVSYHGLPARYDRREGGGYSADCAATTRAFLEAIGWPPERATLAYQSRFGPERWLAPSTAGVLAELPRRGVRHVAVITPGFLTEGLETVEEIGIRGAETFVRAGGETLMRIGAVEDEPAMLASLMRLATG
jgi:ferrochelatase